MTELLLPRLKQEIEARLGELRPLVAEIEQLEAAKAALLARGELPVSLPARRRLPAPAVPATRRARRGAATAPKAERPAAVGASGAEAEAGGEDERAPRGANRDAILALIEERPGVSVAEIASVTKIAKPTVASTVSKLKRDGLLADEAGGVKLASRQPLSIAGPVVETPAEASTQAAPSDADGAPAREEAVSESEWEAAAPAAAGEDAA